MHNRNGLYSMFDFSDPEWEEAEAADEIPKYYWCQMYNYGWTIHLYKPSIAKLKAERLGFLHIFEYKGVSGYAEYQNYCKNRRSQQ